MPVKIFFCYCSLIVGILLNAQTTWTWIDPVPTGVDFDEIAYGNGIIAAGGWLSDGIYMKPDGGSWRKALSLGSYEVQFADGLFRIGGGVVDSKFIKTSPDGITWSDIPVPSDIIRIGRFGYHNNAWVVLEGSNYSGDTYYSPDNGANWTKLSALIPPAAYVTPPQNVKYILDRWFILGYKVFLSSTDGINWNPVSLPGGATDTYYDIAYGNGFMLVTASQDRIYKSTDGVTWTLALDGSHATIDRVSISFNNGVFLVSRDGYPGQLDYTTDGLTYTPILNVAENRSDDLVANVQFNAHTPWGTGFLVTGYHGFVLGSLDVTLGESSFVSQTPAGYHHDFHQEPFGVSGSNILTYRDGFQLSEDNGLTWGEKVTDLPNTVSNPNLIRNVNGKWFALNLYSHISNDGTTWTKLTTPSTLTIANRVPLTDVDYDGSRYIGIISLSNVNSYFATSTDGITWAIDETNRPPDRTAGLRFIGGKYILIGLGANYGDGNVWSSDDLVTWSAPATINPLFNVDHYQDILFKNGVWCISTETSSFYSSDALTWTPYPYQAKQPTRRIVEYNGSFYSSDYNQAMIGSLNLIDWKLLGIYTPYDLISVAGDGIFARNGSIGMLYYAELPAIPIPEPFQVKSFIWDETANAYVITTPSEEGEYYYLEYTDDLSYPVVWTPDYSQFKLGTGGTLTFQAEVVSDSRFFHVRIY